MSYIGDVVWLESYVYGWNRMLATIYNALGLVYNGYPYQLDECAS